MLFCSFVRSFVRSAFFEKLLTNLLGRKLKKIFCVFFSTNKPDPRGLATSPFPYFASLVVSLVSLSLFF